MTKTYRYTTSLEDPRGNDAEVHVSYKVHWGTPETGAGYMADPYKYDPGSPTIVEAVKVVTVNGQPPNRLQELWYALSIEACYEDMIQEAQAFEER